LTASVRTAGVADLEALVALAVAFRDQRGESHPAEAEYRQAYAALLVDPESEFLIALDVEEPAGFALSRFRRASFGAGRAMEIEDLFVQPAQRRRGIGRSLIARALEQGAARGCRTAALTTNERNAAARAVYAGLGLRPESEAGAYAGGLRLWLERALTPTPRVTPELLCIDHVQLAMPPGREADVRAFYAGALGLREVPKPAELAARGGCWFEHGPLRVHLGVEADFRPARKAHPAFRVAGLDALVARCRAQGFAASAVEQRGGERRAYLDDPFGNRIEVVELV
jgi:ribosomal protein S18 acetylase RimI-like enzyme/catechol 2,3-dioxygenase-like lactoylglutathione lyase family enzyme